MLLFKGCKLSRTISINGSVELTDDAPHTIRLSLRHLLPHLNQVLHVAGAIHQELLHNGPRGEVGPWGFGKHLLHGLLQLVDALGGLPPLQNLVESRSLCGVDLLERVLEGMVELPHLPIASALLQVNLHAGSIKHIPETHPQAGVEGDGVLLAGVEDLEVVFAFEDGLDEVLEGGEQVGQSFLEEVDVYHEDVLPAGQSATDLHEIDVAVLGKLALQVHSEHIARLQHCLAKVEGPLVVNHHRPLIQQLPVLLFIGSSQWGLFGVKVEVVFVGMGAVDDDIGVGKWPEVDFLPQFQQCQLDEVFEVDEVIHVDFILGETLDEKVDVFHPVAKALLLLEVFFQQLHQLLEVFL